MPGPNKNEIVIATIGLVGVLVTALFSNWDKIFPPENVIQTTYSGYRATGDFETELRYYFVVSGFRKTIESQQDQILKHLEMQALAEDPEDAEEIGEIFEAIRDEAITLDEVLKEILPVYRKHFTVAEMQELNRFYSTETMQSMMRKMPLLTQELAPIQVKMLAELQSRISDRIDSILFGED